MKAIRTETFHGENTLSRSPRDRRLAGARSGSIHGARISAGESDAAPVIFPRHAEQVTDYPKQQYLRIGPYRLSVVVDLESEPSDLELRDQDSPHSKSTAGQMQAILLDMEGNPSDLQHSFRTYLQCGFCVSKKSFVKVLRAKPALRCSDRPVPCKRLALVLGRDRSW
jgi:hypothetical protein